MKAYSTDGRERIALAYQHHAYTLDEVAELFDVGRRTVTRCGRKRRPGLSLAPLPPAGGYPSALKAETRSMDNLPAHKASAGEESAASARAEVIWRPADSPDFSPNENCWLKVKTFGRGRPPRTAPDLNEALSAAIRVVTREDIAAWFKHCGY